MMRGPLLCLALVGCAKPVEVSVELVNPCNQQSIESVDFLRFVPRGRDIDSVGLSRTERAADKVTPAIPIPLANDFRLVVTGHVGEHDAPQSAIGVSARHDLLAAQGPVTIRVPFALVDAFYRTTDLDDPVSCTQMAVARYGATLTFLPQIGRALVVGGETLKDGAVQYMRSIEMYDPGTGRFEIVGELRAGAARAFHTATLLADGKVLVAGGEAINGMGVKEALTSALLIDPGDPTRVVISNVIRMPRPRTGHGAVRLANGLVALLGGRELRSTAAGPQDHVFPPEIDVFDPTRGEFVSLPGASGLEAGRYGHSTTLLASGTAVLVAGGYNQTGVLRTFEVARIANDGISVEKPTTGPPGFGPVFHAAAITGTGRLLFAGGYDQVDEAEPRGGLPTNPSANVETWEYVETRRELNRTCNAQMRAGRGFHTVTMLEDPMSDLAARVLFVGGRDASGRPTDKAEIATLASGVNPGCFRAPPGEVAMESPRAQHTTTAVGTGELLVLGGRRQDPGDQFGTSLSTAELFNPQRDP